MMLTKYNKWLNKLVDLAASTLLCLLVFSFFNTGHAKNNECPTKPVILTDQFFILDDSSRSLTIEQVSSPDFFQEFNKNKAGRINLGLSNSAHWVRIDSSLFFDCEQEWFLLFSWGQQDYINFYWQENNSWHQVVTGAKQSYSSRQIKDRKFWFHIPDLSKNHRPYFIRLEGKQTMLLMSLWNQDILSLYSSSFQLAFGIYLGILVGFIFYNLCVFFSLRDTSYLYYVIYLISIALVVADSQGLTMQYLWSDKPEWSARFSSSCLLLSTISYLYFVSKFLNSLSFSPKSHRLIRFYIKILLTFLCVSFFYTSTVVAIIIPALATIGFSLSIIIIAISIKSNYRPAIFVGLANIIILGGMFWAATILGGIFPIEIHSDYEGMWWAVHLIFPVSILLEAILLSLALASRIKLLKQENLLVQQKLVTSKERLSSQLIAAQDNAQKILAADLHDGIGQNLMVINNRINRLRHVELTPKMLKQVGFIADITQQTIHDVRGLAHHLHPHQLDKLGLSVALETLAHSTLKDAGISLDCLIETVDDLVTKENSLHLYRVTQEALKNIQAHANADQVSIQLASDDTSVNLIICDNGNGIQGAWFEQKDYSRAFGLSSMQERVQLMGGIIDISNRQPKGLALAVSVWLDKITERRGVVIDRRQKMTNYTDTKMQKR